MKPLVAVPVKYGLIGSILAIGLISILYYSGTHPLLIPTFYDYRILLFGLFIFFGSKEFKDYYNGGFLQFWQGMIIGILIYLIIGIVVALFIMTFSSIEPDFYKSYVDGTISGLELNKDQLLNQGPVTITKEEFNQQVEMLKSTPTYYLGLDYLIKSTLIGFFITILMAVILRRSEKRFSK